MSTPLPRRMTACQKRILSALKSVAAPSLYATDLHEMLIGHAVPRQINAALVLLERMGYVHSRTSETDPLAQRHYLITQFGKEALARANKAVQTELDLGDMKPRKKQRDVS